MKQNVMILFLFLVFFSCKKEPKEAHLEVSLENVELSPGQKIYIYDFVNEARVDSVEVTDGQTDFSFHFPSDQILPYFIMMSNGRPVSNSTLLMNNGEFAENISFSTDRTDNEITKTYPDNTYNEQYDSYREQITPYKTAMTNLNAEYEKIVQGGGFSSNEQEVAFHERYTKAIEDEEDFSWKYAKENKNPAGLLVMMTDLRMSKDYDKMKEALQDYPKEFISNPMYINQKEKLEHLEKLQVGHEAPDFTIPSVDGTEVSLSDFRGNYVLIDFWASWCGPCRRENPNLVKTYQKYNDKGFEILGVSYDAPNGKEAWLKAIETDGLVWTQVSNLKGWDDPTVELYQVYGIPSPMLVDREGKILASGDELRGSNLEEFLSTIEF